MKHLLAVLFLMCLPVFSVAQDHLGTIRGILDDDILPGFIELERRAEALSAEAQAACTSDATRQRFIDAFHAWARVSHLRFGPSEEDNRAFALAFWPDPRGKTPRALRQILQRGDPTVLSPEVYREQSIAVRGFYALEYLLYDPDIAAIGTAEYHCAHIRAVTRDIHQTTQALSAGWLSYGQIMLNPGPDSPYRTAEESLQALYKSAATGLQFTADMRFGRPLGTFDRPRPRRAEAWRSGQSLNLIAQAVEASGYLAERLGADDERLTERLDDALLGFLKSVEELDDPDLSGVATPQGRVRVESLLTQLTDIRGIVEHDLAVHLGVISGFNALDGD